MTVRVTCQGVDDDHKGGQDVRLVDNHLMIMNSVYNDAQVVAVYAPGQWEKAVLNPSTAGS